MSDPLDAALGLSLRKEADGFTPDNAPELTESSLVELVRGRRIRRRHRAWGTAVAALSAAAVVFVVLALTALTPAPSRGSYTADPPSSVAPGGGESAGSVTTVPRPVFTTHPATTARSVPSTSRTSSSPRRIVPTAIPVPAISPPVARTTPDSVTPSAPTATTTPSPTSTLFPTPSSTAPPPSTTIPIPPRGPMRLEFTWSDSGSTVRVPLKTLIEVDLTGCPGTSPPAPRSSHPSVVKPQGGPPPSASGERSALYLAAHAGRSTLASPATPGACASAARPFVLHIIVQRS